MTGYPEFNVNAQDQTVDNNLARTVRTSYFAYGLSLTHNNPTWENLPGDTVNYDNLKEVALAILRNAGNPDDPGVRSISFGAGRVGHENALTIIANKRFNGIFRRVLTVDEGINLARRIAEARGE